MSRDWQDERWIKLYTRDEPEWLVIHWKWRGLFDEILKHLDPAGTMRLGKAGRRAIAASLSAVWDDELSEGVAILAQDGAIVFLENETVLFVPNFGAAQEAKQSDKARQQKRRARVKSLGQPSSHDPVVYFLLCGDRVKIGKSTNLTSRIRMLQTDSADELVLLGVEPMSQNVTDGHGVDREAELHTMFRQHHVRGEWFHASKEILTYAATLSRDVTSAVTRCDVGCHAVKEARDVGSHTLSRRERERERSERRDQKETPCILSPVKPEPVPKPPVPKPLTLVPDPEPNLESAPARRRALPANWTPTEAHRKLALQEGRDIERELEKFRDDAVAKRKMFVDWDAAFRNWLRSDIGRDKPSTGGNGVRRVQTEPEWAPEPNPKFSKSLDEGSEDKF